VLDDEQLDQLTVIAERVVEHLRGESLCTGAAPESEGCGSPQLASPE
jgi:hypothetical protein